MLTARYVWCTYQNVFITGGSQGLGLALAKQLVAQGANVVLCSRSEAKLVRAVQEVEPYRQSSAQTIQYVAADVSSFAGAAQGLAKCPWVPCTVFCCAGGAQPGLFLEQTESDFEAAMKTDYWTALSTAHVRPLANPGGRERDARTADPWPDCVCQLGGRPDGAGRLCAVCTYEVCYPR